jgi:hypothetical protein
VSLIAAQNARTVRRIRIQIGDEWAQHDFGREVDLTHARMWAMHFVESFTSDGASPTSEITRLSTKE